jgi:hypothetical protein
MTSPIPIETPEGHKRQDPGNNLQYLVQSSIHSNFRHGAVNVVVVASIWAQLPVSYTRGVSNDPGNLAVHVVLAAVARVQQHLLNSVELLHIDRRELLLLDRNLVWV